VLINLATNARDAMPEGGVLSITIEIVVLPETTSQTRADQKPGNYALITVSDTGIGMSKKTVESIFEPFFTTKEVGKGTGLGLSIVYGIIKQHNGYVDVCSEPGSGTIFRIYLPLVDARDQGNLKAAASKERTIGGNQTILVAEDDVAARALIKEVLETYGYSVIEAVDGEDAVNRFEEHRDNIDLVVIDVIMPKKNGRAVYEHITKTRPRIRTLFISGYTADIINEKGISDKNLNFLSKPVAPDVLVAKVREVLDLPGT
jgi:CheY-like chemotaxis protein